MKCDIHPDVELIPHIFTDSEFIKNNSCIQEDRTKPRRTYCIIDCPVCTQEHWQKVYKKFGTYFGYWDEV